MKLIFLDLDGVVNNRTSMDRVTIDPASSCYVVDPVNVKALNRIIETTGAMIVVSSIRRYRFTMRLQIQDVLRKYGIVGTVFGMLPRICMAFGEDTTRGDEIAEWLREAQQFGRHKDLKFVVIDDDSDISPFEDRFVQTSFETGLTEVHADRAIALLED